LNTSATGNPIYPLTLALGGWNLLRGSPYTDWLAAELGSGGWRDDWFQIVQMFNYYADWETPTSAGPKYIVLVPLALIAALWGRGGRAGSIRLVVALAVIGLAVAQLQDSGLPMLSRRFWPGSASRLVGISWGLFAVAGLTVLPRLDAWRATILRSLLVGFIIWDLAVADTRLAARAPVVCGLAALAVFAALPSASSTRRRAGAVVAVVVTGLGLGLPILNAHRAETRWLDYAETIEVEEAPKEFVRGWQYTDQSAPLRIAFTAGPDLRGQNGFIYPLMGRRLQNTVTYVPLNQSDPPGSKGFILRERPRFTDWVEGLRRAGTEVVYVQSPWPIEDVWMREDPGGFALVLDDPHVRVYEVVAPLYAPAR
jgi:hypothetical protein